MIPPTVATVMAQVRASIWRQVRTTPAGRLLVVHNAKAVESLVENIVGNLVAGVVANLVADLTDEANRRLGTQLAKVRELVRGHVGGIYGDDVTAHNVLCDIATALEPEQSGG